MLDFHYNPAKVFGIGLSANVFGILLGGMIGSVFRGIGIENGISILAIGVAFMSLTILPLLHKYLLMILKNQEFLLTLSELASTKQDETISSIISAGKLTQRESEIVELLLKGRTYRMIADELHLSENTVKTHIKNIYSKLEVNNKTELVKLAIEK